MFLGVVGLGLAWRWEKVAVILLPILSPAILFLVCWSRSDRETKTSSV
jgi:hypothetical protein